MDVDVGELAAASSSSSSWPLPEQQTWQPLKRAQRARITPAQRAWFREAYSGAHTAPMQANQGYRPDLAVPVLIDSDSFSSGRRNRDLMCSACGPVAEHYNGSDMVCASDIVSTRLVAATCFCSEDCALRYYEQALVPVRPELMPAVEARIRTAFLSRQQSLVVANAVDGHVEIVSAVEAGLFTSGNGNDMCMVDAPQQ